MNSAKRILSLFVALLVILSSLVSCDVLTGKPEDVISKADEALNSAPYKAETEVTFTSDDEDMKAAIEALGDMKITVTENGENASVVTDMTVGGVDVNVSNVIVSKMLYHKKTVDAEGAGSFTLKKASLGDNRAELITNAAPGAQLTVLDFDTVEMKSSGNVRLITCTSLKAESSLSVREILSERLGISVDSVSLGDVELVIRVVDGKYEGTYLSCRYEISMGNADYELRLQAVTSYSYENIDEVKAPSNFSEYELCDYDEIL